MHKCFHRVLVAKVSHFLLFEFNLNLKKNRFLISSTDCFSTVINARRLSMPALISQPPPNMVKRSPANDLLRVTVSQPCHRFHFVHKFFFIIIIVLRVFTQAFNLHRLLRSSSLSIIGIFLGGGGSPCQT